LAFIFDISISPRVAFRARTFNLHSQRAAITRAARGEPSRFDAVNRTASDRFITVDFMLAPLFDERGRVTHLIPSAVDITEKRRLEAELARASHLSLVGELAAGIAHEVKNPSQASGAS
jgi:C4-dicarboxylate-specific signal transduction histidine kinase